MAFVENNTGEITAVAYLLFIAEIVNSVWQIETGALLIVYNYVPNLILGNGSSIYLFDSHIKDENYGSPSSGTAVLVKFSLLYSLENSFVLSKAAYKSSVQCQCQEFC